MFVANCSSTHGHTLQDLDLGEWMTEAELAGPKGFNDKKLASIAIQDMKSRPHRNAALASNGVLQYFFETDKSVKEGTVEDRVVVEQKADMTADDAQKVKAHMRKGLDPEGVQPLMVKDKKKKKEDIEKEKREKREQELASLSASDSRGKQPRKDCYGGFRITSADLQIEAWLR